MKTGKLIDSINHYPVSIGLAISHYLGTQDAEVTGEPMTRLSQCLSSGEKISKEYTNKIIIHKCCVKIKQSNVLKCDWESCSEKASLRRRHLNFKTK